MSRYYTLTWREFDGRKLQFLTSFRPAARYMYFHYCVQILRVAWQYNEAKSPKRAATVLKDENGKPYWGTPGRYLPKNMLLALVEELGHEYQPLLEGAGSKKSRDSDLLLELAAAQVKSRRPNLEGLLERDYDTQSGSDGSSELDSEMDESLDT